MSYAVTSVLLDQPYLLLYRTRDVVEVEERMGKPIPRALVDAGTGDLAWLLWAGLRHQESTLTRDEVMARMDKAKRPDGAYLYQLWGRVGEALVNSGILPPPARTDEPVDPSLAHDLGSSRA